MQLTYIYYIPLTFLKPDRYLGMYSPNIFPWKIGITMRYFKVSPRFFFYNLGLLFFGWSVDKVLLCMHNNNNNNIHVCISHELHIFFRTKNAKNSPHLIFYTFHSILMYVEGPNSKVHPFDITYNFFFAAKY